MHDRGPSAAITRSARPAPRMRARHGGWIAPLVAGFLAACGIGPDERSGGDAGRGDAQPAQLDTLLYDRVSVDDGDSTDWKSFKLEEGGKVTVNVWWDDPKAVGASVELRDMDAKSLVKLKHKGGVQQERLGPVKLKEGTYFLRIQASSGGSVYSYEISTGSGDVEDAVPDL
jgi:hypothetical protein